MNTFETLLHFAQINNGETVYRADLLQCGNVYLVRAYDRDRGVKDPAKQWRPCFTASTLSAIEGQIRFDERINYAQKTYEGRQGK